MKIAYITSVFGDRKNYPNEFVRMSAYDYFLFSDRDQEDFKTSWDVINISDNPNITGLDCNVRKSRYAKFLGYELLDSMGVEYDCIYIVMYTLHLQELIGSIYQINLYQKILVLLKTSIILDILERVEYLLNVNQ